jgi:ribosomal protein S18 acetylase RimI-like enzyme
MSAPSPAVNVRRADRTDVHRVVPLFGAYREFYHQRPDPAREREFLTERLERDECAIFVAESDGTFVGFTLLYPMFSSEGLRPSWVLNDLYVLPAFRRQGVGAQLLRRAKEFGRETHAAYLTLETARDNPAQHLYESEGWTRDEVFLHYELRS